MRISWLAATAGALLLTAAPSAARSATPACAAKASDAGEIAATVKSWFAAIVRQDYPAAIALTTPNFYAYDFGKHFPEHSLFTMLKDRGVRLEFNLYDIDVHVDCGMAWAKWDNKGKVGADTVAWVESAVLRRTPAGWRIEFLHSTRAYVEPKTPPSR